MAAMPTPRERPWGLIALLLALLAWAGLVGAVFAFAASFGSPGDGSRGMQAMQFWILGALAVAVLSSGCSAAAIGLSWRRRRGAVTASLAGVLLAVMVALAMLVIGANRS